MSTRRWLPHFTIFAVFSACSLAFGDRPPKSQPATGKAEDTLAGINVREVPIEEVIEKLGPPESKRDVPDADGCVHEYNWSRDGVRTRVRTGCLKKATTESVSYIDVWGSKALSDIGKTGKGLKLGDGFSAVRRIYGEALSQRFAPNGLIHIEVHWTDDTILVIDCDRNRAISHIQLGVGRD